MNDTVSDISDTLAANSEELCNTDLIGGPVRVRVERVTRNADPKRPVTIHLSGGLKPWRPGVELRRRITEKWGPDARQWVGRELRLFRDPEAKDPNGKVAGGTRINGMSHIDGPFTMEIKARSRVIASYRVDRLDAAKALTLDEAIDPLGITRAQVAAWHESAGHGPLTAAKEPELAKYLAIDPKLVAAVRAHAADGGDHE